MTRFDLIHESWVPVSVAGRREDVSLLEALSRAQEIDGLANDDPLQAVAVLRQVLLPVTVAALGAPRNEEEWADRWDAGRLDAERIGAYLDQHTSRFDLFDDTAPFAQVAGLRTDKTDTKPVSLLVPAMASGNNVPLFSARTEADPPSLTPGQAVRALLAAHCWDTAAIKSGAVGDPQAANGKTTGNPTGPLGQLGVIVPLGRNLAETLLLNTPIISAGLNPGDRPQWRREPATAQWRRRPAEGLLDLLTWQSRRIRLVPETDGGKGVVVRQVVLAAGDRLDQTPSDIEPHTAWRQNPKPKAGEPPSRPVRHQPGRSTWQGLSALLATAAPTADHITSSLLLRQIARLRVEGYLPETFPLQVLTVGVQYGNQSAVVEDVMADQIPLPVLALVSDAPARGVLLEVVRQAEDLRQAANRLGDDLRAACGAEKVPWDRSQRLGDILVHQFTPVVRRLLAGLQREPDRVDEASEAWREAARRLALDVAEPALAAAPPEAFLGREVSERLAHRLATAEARYRAAIIRTLGPTINGDHRGEPHYGRSVTMTDAPTAAPAGPAGAPVSPAEGARRPRYWRRLLDDRGQWRGDGPPGEDLAALRQGVGREAGTVPAMWPFYTTLNADGRVTADLRAEHVALTLYGVHQQSERRPMHRAGVGVGTALLALRRSGRFSAQAVDRRFAAAATATSLDEAAAHLRGLVTQLRSIDQPLDYDRLMRDLRDWQFPERVSQVRRQWGSQYFAFAPSQDGEAATPESTSTDG